MSIIRRGNHFIRLDGCGWVLIDGPWYRQLEEHRNPHVLMYSLKPLSVAMIEESESYPDIVQTREVTWERLRWLPSHSGNVWKNFVGVCLFDRWQRLLHNRLKFGWRMLPDGVLPAYLCQPELAEDWQHSNYLMEKGY